MSVPAGELRRLAYFVEIVRCGSIRAAGRSLGLSAPVLSAALAELEASMDTSLLQRTTRRQALTARGEEVFREASAMCLAAEKALALGAREARPEGRLAITLPVELAAHWLPRLIPDFAAQFPEVELHVFADDRAVDLATSPYELALRTRFRGPDELGDGLSMPLALVVAPAPAQARRRSLARRLAETPLISAFSRSGNEDYGSGVLAWRSAAERPRHFPMSSSIRVNSRLLARDLAIAGLGAALLLAPAVEADIAAGRLVALGDGLSFGHVEIVPLLRDQHPSPAARAFVGFLEDWAKRNS